MNGFTDGRHYSVGFVREMGGFTDREIFGIPESQNLESGIQSQELI